jgi:hypothetical protein
MKRPLDSPKIVDAHNVVWRDAGNGLVEGAMPELPEVEICMRKLSRKNFFDILAVVWAV